MSKSIQLLILTFFCIFGIKHSFAIDNYEPVAIDSRIKTFIHSENEIFNLKFRIGYNSIIEFGKDETIELISLGDPYPWKLTPIDRRLFMKPIEPGVKTNMTVLTNKRSYLFEIESDISDNIESIDTVHVARFFYPTINMDKVENYNLAKSENRLKDILSQKQTSDSVNSINILYSFAGKPNKSTPTEIFDDKRKTYIRLQAKKPDYKAVKVYLPQKNGKKTPLKFKKTGDFMVLNGVFSKIIIEYQGVITEVYNDVLTL